jgi:hypothetical protein
MAHAGALGPVIKRRDFNLNVTNNNAGWFNGWEWDFLLLPDGVGHGLLGKRIFSYPARETAFNTLTWRGPASVIHARYWEVGLDVTIPPSGESYQILWTLYEALTNIVWKIDFTATAEDARLPRLTNTPSTVYYNPLYFDVKPNALSVRGRSMLWDDYPP